MTKTNGYSLGLRFSKAYENLNEDRPILSINLVAAITRLGKTHYTGEDIFIILGPTHRL